MAYTLLSNGVRSEWDETITIGQLIRTYNEGYHILERIEFRQIPKNSIYNGTGMQRDVVPVESDWNPELDQIAPLFHYVKVLKDDGSKSKALKGSCDASFCSKVTGALARKNYTAEVIAADQKLSAVLQFCE